MDCLGSSPLLAQTNVPQGRQINIDLAAVLLMALLLQGIVNNLVSIFDNVSEEEDGNKEKREQEPKTLE